MKRATIGLLAALLVISLSFAAQAAVPQLINYQGRLTDNGVPLSGTHSLKFVIFANEAGTVALWQETQPAVTVTDGLFQVLLGSVVPIPSSVFSGDTRWLAVSLNGGPQMTPLKPIVSTAYAYRAAKSDTSSYALSSGGTSGGGWTDNGTTVTLSTVGDSVGIGTSNPAYRLDVAGALRATDSVQTNKLVLGKASTTTGGLNLYSSHTSLPIVQLSGSSTGGTVQVRDEAGNSSAYLKSSTEPGGLLSIARNAVGTVGFYVDGNTGTEEPRVSVLGSTRSAIFDMGVSGDEAVQLPSSCIASTEILNEAGIANTRRTTVVNLTDTLVTVASRMVRFPSDGYALIIASGSVSVQHSWEDTITFGVSNSATSFPVNANVLHLPDALPNGNYRQPLMAQGYFSVDAGIQTFYLLVKRPLHNNNCSVSNANLAVMYFPTNYLYIMPPAATAGDGIDAVQLEMDQLIEQKITKREQAMREEFDAKLKTVQQEMKRQIENGDR